MSPGDRDPHPHARHAGRVPDRPDRPDDRPERLDDRVGRQRLRAHPVPARLEHLPCGAVRVPPRVLAPPTRAATPGRRTPTTWPCRTRSATSRTACKLDANFNCAKPGAQDKGSAGRGRRQQLLRPGHGLDARQDQRLLQRRTRTSTGSRTSRTGREPTPTRARTRSCTRRRSCSRARSRTGRRNYSTIAFEADLPRIEADGLAGQPAVLRPDDRRELRQPAARRAVLSVLLDDRHAQRHLHLAGGRQLHPRHDQRLRRQLDDRVRPAAATVVSRRRAHRRPTRINNFNSGDMPNPCPVTP